MAHVDSLVKEAEGGGEGDFAEDVEGGVGEEGGEINGGLGGGVAGLVVSIPPRTG